ncbi:MAG: hypothetical protein Q9Q40_11920, partial [Acidobacteriota bacterium]|nr:hypothetical protein [Acidobacteriota bacterium]
GGAPVTRGVIATNRMAVYLPDANVILTGHTHDEWLVPIARERCNGHGTVYRDEQLHVRVPGYKGAEDPSSWATQRGYAPKTTGAAWLAIYRDGPRVAYEVQRAR